VVQGGTGLAFVVYPESLAAMPGAPVFSLLFFTMLLCLGLDTQFAMVETLMAALRDIPQVTMRKERLSALLCALMLACGTIFVTEQGVHWLEVFDTFVANISLFLVGLVECVAVGWLYGAKHFSADANAMCGRPLPKPLLWNLQASSSPTRRAVERYLLTHPPTRPHTRPLTSHSLTASRSILSRCCCPACCAPPP
jgi:solute carrier family 6 amino acid transporter-like protein 5/7/9/14